MSKHSTSTPPHRTRPSAAELDRVFAANNKSEHVRTVHALYIEAAIALLRVARRLEALNEGRAAAVVEAQVVMIEAQAARHIEAIALRAEGQ
jgi:hypothetical protein